MFKLYRESEVQLRNFFGGSETLVEVFRDSEVQRFSEGLEVLEFSEVYEFLRRF